MEMILCSAKVYTYEITGPSMETFMDVVTLVAEFKSHIEQLVTCLQEFFKWATIKMKLPKCQCLSIIKGNCKEIKFPVDGNENPKSEKKVLKALVTATSYHILIDIVGRT